MNKKFPKFSFAFQPIVNVTKKCIYSFEALVRGENNESASHIFKQIEPERMHQFDDLLRKKAISLAVKLGVNCNLNLNFLPSGLQGSMDAISKTMDSANQFGMSLDKLVVEITESEPVENIESFAECIYKCRTLGFGLSIDDFGAGYSGLNFLAEFQPDSIKLDMSLIRDIHTNGPKQAIIRGVICTCQDLGIQIIAEGVEIIEEYLWLKGEGVELFQGYLFAKPEFESLPCVYYPD